MSNYSFIQITHPEDSTEMKLRLQAETGQKTKAMNRSMLYLASLSAGVKRASVNTCVGAVKASGTFTFAKAVADNTAVINGVTLTAKVSPSGESQFALGAGDDAAAANLVTKINAHSSALLDGVVTASKTTDGVAEVTTITCVADSSGSLHTKYFKVYDQAGSVGVWFDIDDAGGSAPAGALACTRQIEVSTVATGDSAGTVATKVAAVLEADSQFTAAAVSTAITLTNSYVGDRTNATAGDSGFTMAVATAGVSPVVTITADRPGVFGNCVTLSATGGLSASGARATGGTDGTQKTFSYGGGV